MGRVTVQWTMAARVLVEGDNHVMEDDCGFVGPTAWMIDGATSLLDEINLPSASDPSWLAHQLNVILGSTGGPGAAREILGAAFAEVDAVAEGLVGDERQRFPSAALSLAQLHDDSLEVLALADCHVVAESSTGDVDHVGPTRGGTSLTREQQHRGRLDRNTDGGVWVARREAEAAERARRVELPVPSRMVMATDGAWRAVDLGVVATPEEFLVACADPIATLRLMTRLREHQAEIGERADDATVLSLRATTS